MPLKVIYPGSFDPITNGHMDIIERAHGIFGGLTVLIAETLQKSSLFTIQERMELIRQATSHLKKVRVDSTGGLLVDYARVHSSRILIRGLRAVSDFDYEYAMTSMNRSLLPELETVFLMTNEHVFYISSRLIKEVAKHGGDCRKHVPPVVLRALRKKFTSRVSKR